MVEIDDLDSAGKMLGGEIPDPLGAIADDYLLFGAAPAAFPGFDVQPLAELLGGFDSAGIRG